jgi:adenosylhomocysteine nucleosidase
VTSVLVVTALELEARTLARALGLARDSSTAWPHFRRGVIEVACVGLRAMALDERSTSCRPPALVVVAGVCGALSPALGEGALVVPDAVVTAAGDRFAAAPLPGLAASGTLYCSRDVVDTPPDKARLWMETGAVAVDLESGPVLAWARARGVPAAVVRAVSDSAAASVPAELVAAVAADGSLSTPRAVRTALAHPTMLGRALTLRRGTSAALSTVARALGTLARAISDRA